VTTRHPWEDFADTPLDRSAAEAHSRVRALLADLGHTVVDLEWTPKPGYSAAFVTIWKSSAVGLDLSASQRELAGTVHADTWWRRASDCECERTCSSASGTFRF
jgi:hypothetical protein